MTDRISAAQLAAERITKFCNEYGQMRGIDPEHVYRLHLGSDQECGVTISDLRALAEGWGEAEAATRALRELIAWHDAPVGPEPIETIRRARALVGSENRKADE